MTARLWTESAIAVVSAYFNPLYGGAEFVEEWAPSLTPNPGSHGSH